MYWRRWSGSPARRGIGCLKFQFRQNFFETRVSGSFNSRHEGHSPWDVIKILDQAGRRRMLPLNQNSGYNRAQIGPLFPLWWLKGARIIFAKLIRKLTRYRDYLQHDLGRQPTTINRYLVSLKSYFR